MPIIVETFANFYTHLRARSKLPKTRRKIGPAESTMKKRNPMGGLDNGQSLKLLGQTTRTSLFTNKTLTNNNILSSVAWTVKRRLIFVVWFSFCCQPCFGGKNRLIKSSTSTSNKVSDLTSGSGCQVLPADRCPSRTVERCPLSIGQSSGVWVDVMVLIEVSSLSLSNVFCLYCRCCVCMETGDINTETKFESKCLSFFSIHITRISESEIMSGRLTRGYVYSTEVPLPQLFFSSFFHRDLSGIEAEKLLQEKSIPGSFLVRPSTTKSDAYVLSVR